MSNKPISKTALLFLAMTGCGVGCGHDVGSGSSLPGGAGDLGATPGGAKDIGFARDVIEHGGVPPADSITVEGLLSEHDLPPFGAPCESLLCVRPGLGIAPSLETGRLEHWIHVGMTTGLPAATFERPPLDVVAVIDKSAAMSIDMSETTEAVARLIRSLRPDDRMAIVAFDTTVSVLQALGPVADAADLEARVRAIRAGGGADLTAGTAEGYRLLRAAGASPGRLRRVMVFSCGYPSLAPDRSDPYSTMVRAGADEGIGLSFFGVLLGYSPDLAGLLGTTAGGAYYYLESLEKVVRVFDADFDVMVTPVAYDLRFELEVAPSFELARFYGVPGNGAGAPATGYEVATAFLSRRRGALVARLRARDGNAVASEVATVALSYRPEPALGWMAAENQVATVTRPALSDDELYFQGLGVRKAAALVNQAERMREACRLYASGDRAAARAVLAQLLEYLRGEAQSLEDAGLAAEVALVEKLLANIE